MEPYRVRLGETVLVVKQGDLTEEPVDVVVNAANMHLKHGGGLAAAIVRKGGRVIQEESDRIGYVPVGQAVVTTAGNLPARFVVHTVGPRWGEGEEEKKLRSAIRSALEKAREVGATRVALPAVSTGIFGYPKKEGTRVIVEEVVRYIREHPGVLTEVILMDLSGETVRLFREAVDRVVDEGGEHP